MVVAIIPARGGSKRIPDKNIRLFAGEPMIVHSIRSAISCGLFDRIIVSTDSDKIADIASANGAEIPFMRPAALSDDKTATAPVLIHALNRLKEHDGLPRYFCCIYATAPFMQVEYLRRGYELLREEKATTVFPITSFSSPIFRALKMNENGRLEMFWPEYLESRSQDLPTAWHDAGQFYWADTAGFLKEKKLRTNNTIPIILPRYLVHDIDTPEDWKKAELVFRALSKEISNENDR